VRAAEVHPVSREHARPGGRPFAGGHSSSKADRPQNRSRRSLRGRVTSTGSRGRDNKKWLKLRTPDAGCFCNGRSSTRRREDFSSACARVHELSNNCTSTSLWMITSRRGRTLRISVRTREVRDRARRARRGQRVEARWETWGFRSRGTSRHRERWVCESTRGLRVGYRKSGPRIELETSEAQA